MRIEANMQTSLSMLRSETRALVPSSLGGCNLNDDSFFSAIRKHQTARTFRTLSIKVQSGASRNFAWIRNDSFEKLKDSTIDDVYQSINEAS